MGVSLLEEVGLEDGPPPGVFPPEILGEIVIVRVGILALLLSLVLFSSIVGMGERDVECEELFPGVEVGRRRHKKSQSEPVLEDAEGGFVVGFGIDDVVGVVSSSMFMLLGGGGASGGE